MDADGNYAIFDLYAFICPGFEAKSKTCAILRYGAVSMRDLLRQFPVAQPRETVPLKVNHPGLRQCK
jgi:hypothetical protein